MFISRIVITASAAIFAMSASAQIVNFEFTATVNYSVIGSAHVGDKVTGRFSYDLSTAPAYDFGVVAGYAWDVPNAMSATVNNRTAVARHLNVDVADNFNGNVEDTVGVSGSDLSWGGHRREDAYMGFSLASAPGHTDVLHNTGLPTLLNLADFDAWGSGYGYLMENNVLLVGAQLDSITSDYVSTPIPEPTTLALTALGLGPLLLAVRRRARKAA